METSMNYRYVFTVFTPTFNRSQTLSRVYEGLRLQTFRDFEWLIVDDGSTDGTKELVEKWQTESAFLIRYIYQENQGKPAAFNHGVQEARGELFVTLDPDGRKGQVLGGYCVVQGPEWQTCGRRVPSGRVGF